MEVVKRINRKVVVEAMRMGLQRRGAKALNMQGQVVAGFRIQLVEAAENGKPVPAGNCNEQGVVDLVEVMENHIEPVEEVVVVVVVMGKNVEPVEVEKHKLVAAGGKVWKKVVVVVVVVDALHRVVVVEEEVLYKAVKMVGSVNGQGEEEVAVEVIVSVVAVRYNKEQVVVME